MLYRYLALLRWGLPPVSNSLLCVWTRNSSTDLRISVFPQTRDANATGNRPQAERSSRLARILNNTALGIGLVFAIVYIVLVILSVTLNAH